MRSAPSSLTLPFAFVVAGITSGCVGSPPPISETTDTAGSTTAGTALDFVLAGPCLLAPDEQLANLVDTTNLTCTHDSADGDGRIPAGVTLEGCEITGEPAQIFDPPDGPVPQPSVRHRGVWAFVLRVEDPQGNERHVPVCVSYLGDAPINHSIDLLREGNTVSLADPSEASFEVGGAAGFGSVNDPVFQLARTDGLENLEFDQSIVSFTDSPVGVPLLNTLAVQHEQTVLEFWLELGPTPIQDQAVRPFVTTIDLVFCVEYSTSAACDPAHNLEFGSVAVTHSVVFSPDP